jgi:hypothetical protein
LPDDDLVLFALDVVKDLNISVIQRKYEAEERGFPPYHPWVMASRHGYNHALRCRRAGKLNQVWAGETGPVKRQLSVCLSDNYFSLFPIAKLVVVISFFLVLFFFVKSCQFL